MQGLIRGALVALIAALALPVLAQTTQPLRAILPVGAGSGVDTITRAAMPSLTKALNGQPVVVENLPGAGGITGTQAIVKAAPDGSTIGIVSNNHVINPSVYKQLPFDSISFLRHSIGQTRVSWWRSVLRNMASGSPGVLARLAILANLASDCFVSDDFQSSSSLPA